MAAEEARALLDALMGGDRNAPLPPGAAVPPNKMKRRHQGHHGHHGGSGGALQLPTKRSKSCYDKDICPLYCAWGIDVYELFVNTKSDIGPNPYVIDDGAREEYLSLPTPERMILGFEHFLFQKLHELVRTCDRTVTRNKEKLAQEMKRIMAKRGNTPYVQDVDDSAIEVLARSQLEMEYLQKSMDQRLKELQETTQKEQQCKQKLVPLMKQQHERNMDCEDSSKFESSSQVKKEPETTESCIGDESKKSILKQEDQVQSDSVGKIEVQPKTEHPTNDNSESNNSGECNDTIASLQTELGKLTLAKNRTVWEISHAMSQLAPLSESIESQLRSLYYVKSDIAADKTVCEVSGNFMSARDADERIAAHYAGKQYVGWKLVRTKLEEMIQKYGRYGPPPPNRRPQQQEEMMMMRHNSGAVGGGGPYGGSRGGGRYDSRGGGGYDRGGPPPRGGGRDRYESDRGGSSGYRSRHRGRRSPSPPYWERGSSGGPAHHDRGRRGGGGSGSHRRSGGW